MQILTKYSTQSKSIINIKYYVHYIEFQMVQRKYPHKLIT